MSSHLCSHTPTYPTWRLERERTGYPTYPTLVRGSLPRSATRERLHTHNNTQDVTGMKPRLLELSLSFLDSLLQLRVAHVLAERRRRLGRSGGRRWLGLSHYFTFVYP